MNTLKTFLLAGAASYVAAGQVVAADLPVEAKPVDYVNVRTLYGDGYYYIPGTDTCIKDLDICVDVLYNRIDAAFGGPVNLSVNGTQPAGLRFAKDEGMLSAVFRVQRNFLP